MQKEISQKRFTAYNITIDDLQEIDVLNSRKKLGKGELSSIVFAKKTRQAFLTDNTRARKLGNEQNPATKVKKQRIGVNQARYSQQPVNYLSY